MTHLIKKKLERKNTHYKTKQLWGEKNIHKYLEGKRYLCANKEIKVSQSCSLALPEWFVIIDTCSIFWTTIKTMSY